MLRNNLDPRVALDWKELIIYGGQGRAARNWQEYHRIVRALKSLTDEETLCVQSGKPVYVAPTHKEAPRVVIANSNIVPKWATQENFDRYDEMGLTMYGAVILDVEVRPERIERKVKEGFCERMTADLKEALSWIEESRRKRLPLSVGLVGNAAEIHAQLVRMGVIPELVTDQTPAHDIWGYVPEGELNAME